ncbi:MAG: hypothetical protein WDN29_04025 [Methylovirgula sp.]
MLKAKCVFTLAAFCVGLLGATPLSAQAPSVKPVRHLRVVYLAKHYPEPTPLSFLDQVVRDKGIAGARVGAADNNITGNFVGQQTDLVEDVIPEDADIVAEANTVLGRGDRFIVRRSRRKGPAGRRHSSRGQGRDHSRCAHER